MTVAIAVRCWIFSLAWMWRTQVSTSPARRGASRGGDARLFPPAAPFPAHSLADNCHSPFGPVSQSALPDLGHSRPAVLVGTRRLLVWTGARTWKVKRIRRDPADQRHAQRQQGTPSRRGRTRRRAEPCHHDPVRETKSPWGDLATDGTAEQDNLFAFEQGCTAESPDRSHPSRCRTGKAGEGGSGHRAGHVGAVALERFARSRLDPLHDGEMPLPPGDAGPKPPQRTRATTGRPAARPAG